MSLKTDLVSYWKLDEASGSALDAHASNDLAEVNGSVGSATGKIGNARSYTGSAGHIHHSRASNASLQIGDNVSFEFSLWANFSNQTGNRSIIAKRTGSGTGGNLEFLLRRNSGNLVLLWANSVVGAFGSATIATGLSHSTWYHIFFGYDADNDQFFGILDNGTPVTASDSVGVHTQSNPLCFGSSDGAESYGGLLDEVAFRKGSLWTSGERSEIRNSGNGLAFDLWDAGGGAAAVPQLMLMGVG